MDNDDYDDADYVDEIVIYTSPEGDEIETVFRIWIERRYNTRHPDDEGELVPVHCRRFVRDRRGIDRFEDEPSPYLMQQVWDRRQASIKADNREAEALRRVAA
jgi:hypothetical protein